MTEIQKKLFKLKDDEYKNFHSKLMPTVNSELIIGVRIPVLRKFAKELFGTGEFWDFINSLPHKYYEENNLHAFLTEQIKDYETAVSITEKFLPYIDNWATCDMFKPKIFKKNTDKLILKIYQWLNSGDVYTVRYAIGLLMNLYLDKEFKPQYLKTVSEIRTDEYYINMMIAWYFATALAKRFDETLPFLTEHRLDKWVHNKTIQKATESYRIPNETKLYLKTLKI